MNATVGLFHDLAADWKNALQKVPRRMVSIKALADYCIEEMTRMKSRFVELFPIFLVVLMLTSNHALGEDSIAPGSTFRDCEGCPEMMVIPAGSFRMGDLNGGGDSDENPVHTVTIPNKLAVGKFEVTRYEFSAFVNATGYTTSGECYYHNGSEWKKSSSRNWRSPGFKQTDRDPVVCVNWDDARAYVRWASGKTGKDYRLLSEAEWEYAARSGTATKYHYGNEIASNQANFNRDVGKTTPVGNYPPNIFGLHDMHGNVWEWTEDCYQDSYQGTPANGNANTGSDFCLGRVLRGGSWGSNLRNVRSATRLRRLTVFRSYGYGFRVARTL